jgi:hypothetical protein
VGQRRFQTRRSSVFRMFALCCFSLTLLGNAVWTILGYLLQPSTEREDVLWSNTRRRTVRLVFWFRSGSLIYSDFFFAHSLEFYKQFNPDLDGDTLVSLFIPFLFQQLESVFATKCSIDHVIQLDSSTDAYACMNTSDSVSSLGNILAIC